MFAAKPAAITTSSRSSGARAARAIKAPRYPPMTGTSLPPSDRRILANPSIALVSRETAARRPDALHCARGEIHGGRLIALVLFALTASDATAGSSLSFEDRCARLAAEAKISVVFEDKQVNRSDSRSLSELKRMSGSRANQYHSILGLTHAVPSAKLDVTPNILTDEHGKLCVVPSLVLKLGFSEFEVHLAREIKDPCRRRIVEEHENEHVGVWRNHFRISARLLETVLRKQMANPGYFVNPDEATNETRRHVNEVISTLLRGIYDGAVAANRQIDSPASYQFEEGRMRSCP